MTVYLQDQPQFRRWAVSEAEAQEFSCELEAIWKVLSSQMGQVKKKLKDTRLTINPNFCSS